MGQHDQPFKFYRKILIFSIVSFFLAASAFASQYRAHVSSFKRISHAKKEIHRLKAAGYAPFTEQTDLGDAGVWFRVYLGPYDGHALADKASAKALSKGDILYRRIYRIRNRSGIKSKKKNRDRQPRFMVREEICGLMFADVNGFQKFNGRYEGDCLNGLAHGKGKSTGKRTYEGSFINGIPSGEGQMTSKEGTSYKGAFINGLFFGVGELKKNDGLIYSGDFVNGKYHGNGVLEKPGKVKYSGGFQNGVFHGKGVLNKANKDRFEGMFKNGNLHGEGVYTLHNGAKYTGYFKNGKMHGKGRLIKKDGWTYEGELLNGIPQGKGKYTTPDNETYEGDFVNGEKHGKGIYTNAGGCWYNGAWKNNLKHGVGEEQFKSIFGVAQFRKGFWKFGKYTGRKLP